MSLINSLDILATSYRSMKQMFYLLIMIIGTLTGIYTSGAYKALVHLYGIMSEILQKVLKTLETKACKGMVGVISWELIGKKV